MFFFSSAILLFEFAFGLTAAITTVFPDPSSATLHLKEKMSHATVQHNKTLGTSSKKKAFLTLLQNHGVSLGIAFALNLAEASDSALTTWISSWVFGAENACDSPASQDSAMAFFANVGFFLVLADVGFYCIHRALHRIPWLREMHAKHHRWHSDLMPLAGLDSSVQEYLLNSLALTFPVILGMRLTWLQVHVIAVVVGTNIALTHSSKLQRFNHVAHHLEHHKVHKANFGATILFDTLFHTRALQKGKVKPYPPSF